MFNITDSLSENGHEVIPFSIQYTRNKYSKYENYFVEPLGSRDEITFQEQRLRLRTIWRTFLRLFFSPDVERAVIRLVDDTKPQIAYILHYLRKLSPSILVGLKKAGLPIVVRLSDYAMLCPQAHCLRAGMPCELCINGNLLPSIRYQCLHDSLMMSTVNALATWYHRYRGYFDLIDRFVLTNRFMYMMMIKAGYPENRLQLIPTIYNDNAFYTSPNFIKDGYIVFVGRLEVIKGVHILLDALVLLKKKRPNLNIHLKIIGAGNKEYYNLLINKIRLESLQDMVDFVGEQSLAEVSSLLRRAQLSVIPSIVYENFPNVLVESYACGTPVLASDIGSITEGVKNGETGYLFKPGDPNSLASRLEYCMDHPRHLYTMARNARKIAEEKYSQNQHLSMLEELFNDLID